MIVPLLRNLQRGWFYLLVFLSHSPSLCSLLSIFNGLYVFLLVRCDVLTVEIEHVDVATLDKLERQGVECQPNASTIRIIQVLYFLFSISLFYCVN